MGLNILIPPIRRDKQGCAQPGSIAVLDTDNGTLEFVKDDCLSQLSRNFDFRAFVQEIKD